MIEPFLKWVGSKRQLRSLLCELLPDGARFVEPFVGSGAVFGAVDYPAYLLADNNKDLIGFYRLLMLYGEEFINYCAQFFTEVNNSEDAYYTLRDLFNTTSDAWERAAILLYLNKHGYNGLYRVNSKGGYNVSFGRYKRPYFPSKELTAFYYYLLAKQPTLCAQSYEVTLAQCQPGDVVYCDPPYAPTTATANFTGYTADGFGASDHQALASWAETLQASGVTVVISNSDTEYTRRLYQNATSIASVMIQRSVAAKVESRTLAKEVIAVYEGLADAGAPLGSSSSLNPKASGIMAA